MIRTYLWRITRLLESYIPGAKAKRGMIKPSLYYAECVDAQGNNHKVSIRLSNCNTGRYLYLYDNGKYVKSERIG